MSLRHLINWNHIIDNAVDVSFTETRYEIPIPDCDQTCYICYEKNQVGHIMDCCYNSLCPMCYIKVKNCPFCRTEIHQYAKVLYRIDDKLIYSRYWTPMQRYCNVISEMAELFDDIKYLDELTHQEIETRKKICKPIKRMIENSQARDDNPADSIEEL